MSLIRARRVTAAGVVVAGLALVLSLGGAGTGSAHRAETGGGQRTVFWHDDPLWGLTHKIRVHPAPPDGWTSKGAPPEFSESAAEQPGHCGQQPDDVVLRRTTPRR